MKNLSNIYRNIKKDTFFFLIIKDTEKIVVDSRGLNLVFSISLTCPLNDII